MAAAEAAPLAKVGGLADVIGGLSVALAERGHDVRVALPYYGLVKHSLSKPAVPVLRQMADLLFDQLGVKVALHRAELAERVSLYLIETSRWFSGATKSEAIYDGDPAAYVAFDRACALLAAGADAAWVPEVVHSHDWHAGLTPVYVQLALPHGRPALVHTVHNMDYAGVFSRHLMTVAGLPQELFTFDKLEFYGDFSFLKAGMVYSDMVNTVSETYAREVEQPQFGKALAGLIRYLREQGRFVGITNGIDTKAFDPATDPALPAPFSADDLKGKRQCKATLQSDLGLNAEPRAPLAGMVARICEQKGHDLVAAAADELVGMGMQLAILGVGDATMSEALKAAESRHRGRVAVRLGFDAYLANRIYAGSDMFLMPSRFEPCGLGQLIALRYGSVPVVRRTGGLADTIRDADADQRNGNGFVFDDASVEGLLDGVNRAVSAYGNADRWRRLVLRAMREDHSWAPVAGRYEELYRAAMARRSETAAG